MYMFHGYDVGNMSRNYGIILDEDLVDELQAYLEEERLKARVRSHFNNLSKEEQREQDCIDYMHTL